MPTEPEDDDPQSQAERRRVLRNDQSVRAQSGSTFLDHTHSDLGGRFAATEQQTIVGQDGPPRYPELPSSSPWSGSDPVPDELPLGFDVNALEPVGTAKEVEQSIDDLGPDPARDLGPVLFSPLTAQAPGGSVDAPSASDVERTEPPSFLENKR